MARSHEVDRATLEGLAADHGATIELPGPEGGWARLVVNGLYRFHAWVPAASSWTGEPATKPVEKCGWYDHPTCDGTTPADPHHWLCCVENTLHSPCKSGGTGNVLARIMRDEREDREAHR